jgi:hypothetical protein
MKSNAEWVQTKVSQWAKKRRRWLTQLEDSRRSDGHKSNSSSSKGGLVRMRLNCRMMLPRCAWQQHLGSTRHGNWGAGKAEKPNRVYR